MNYSVSVLILAKGNIDTGPFNLRTRKVINGNCGLQGYLGCYEKLDNRALTIKSDAVVVLMVEVAGRKWPACIRAVAGS
ncbi:hypothetical protein [Aliagarivorans taiwanensis]|uniref:hypothetical protein n=1 Tax=Aliagarivorans taiwanensis TaxID=561966 RepID=UPI0012FCC498|nr:hypothetical protein [Aliagarivorans taiwanensis]